MALTRSAQRAGAAAALAAAALVAGCTATPPAPPALIGAVVAGAPAAATPVPAPSASASAAPPPVASAFGWSAARGWTLPQGVAAPRVPTDNPLSAAKVDLGRRLFYERRLSGTGTFSCASCHEQGRAFADGKAVPTGATGDAHPRNSMGLANVAWASALTWGNPLMGDLETQTVVPLTGDAPIEIGFALKPAAILADLRGDPGYRRRFQASFPAEAGEIIDLAHISKAISAFERTLVSFDAPYDRALRGDKSAISPAAQRGAALFFGERMECAHCHDGPYFTDAYATVDSQRQEAFFHNTGLYNLGKKGDYPPGGEGIYEVTRRSADMGSFRAPSLRNIAVTAPYFHDGSAATLDDALDHYVAGGRTIASGPYAGVGAKNPRKDPLIGGFALSPTERADVVAFLTSLTDETFLKDPAFSDPFGGAAGR